MGALCSVAKDGEYGAESPEFVEQLLADGVAKDLRIAALQEQCEELLHASDSAAKENVEALRRENEELRQRLHETVQELAALLICP